MLERGGEQLPAPLSISITLFFWLQPKQVGLHAIPPYRSLLNVPLIPKESLPN